MAIGSSFTTTASSSSSAQGTWSPPLLSSPTRNEFLPGRSGHQAASELWPKSKAFSPPPLLPTAKTANTFSPMQQAKRPPLSPHAKAFYPLLVHRGSEALARQKQNEEHHKFVALDCEMVGVGIGGRRSILARVTMVDWNGRVVLDEYVKPTEPVTDYRTHVSGITPQDLEAATALDFASCQAMVQCLLQDKVVIGHALENDFEVLGLHHSWSDRRDTATYLPYMKRRRRGGGCLWGPRKLRDLALEHLDRVIQVPGLAHDSLEDAMAALDLYKLERYQWEALIISKC